MQQEYLPCHLMNLHTQASMEPCYGDMFRIFRPLSDNLECIFTLPARGIDKCFQHFLFPFFLFDLTTFSNFPL